MTGAVSPPSVRFINRVYPPGAGATGMLLAQLAENLAARGMAVSVLAAATPGAPREQTERGVRIHRVRPLPVPRQRLALRAVSDLSLYPALLARAARLPPADVTVVMTDPPMAATLGPLVRRMRGGKLLHWAQDLYPDVAAALGAIRPDGLLTRTLGALSRRALNACDAIVTPGRCMEERLAASGIPPGRIHVIPNWTDPERVRPVSPGDNRYRKEWGLDGRHVVMYAGNFGRAHPMHLLTGAAALLRERDDIVWVLVGDGPRRASVEQAVHGQKLDNVQLHPFQPEERLGEMLSAADLHITLLDPRLEGLVVPSKLYGILASGRPCLFAGPGGAEPARVIRELQYGSVLTDMTSEALAEAVLAWVGRPERSEPDGNPALRYARAHSPQAACDAFYTVLCNLSGS